MIRAVDLIALFLVALNEKWGYIWGASGQTWTQAKQSAATRPMTVKHGSKWIGRRVADCSGLFAWAFKQLGGSIYHGSNTIWNKHLSARGKLQNGARTDGLPIKPGTAVFLVDASGCRHHIGLYIGELDGAEDVVVEAKGTAYGVTQSDITRWDEWGELTNVIYEGDELMAEPVLRKGDKGAAVARFQEALMAQGYALPKYGADGDFGAETEAAVRLYQKDNGWAETGVADQPLMDALAESPGETVTVTLPRAAADALRRALGEA